MSPPPFSENGGKGFNTSSQGPGGRVPPGGEWGGMAGSLLFSKAENGGGGGGGAW